MIPKLLLRSSIKRIGRPRSISSLLVQRPIKPTIQSSSTRVRTFASRTEADAKIEEIQELYATARDEFEIASEETEKKTVYAADDRDVAREELQKLKVVFEESVEKSELEVGAEIKARVGQRIRELDRAVEAMEEMAKDE